MNSFKIVLYTYSCTLYNTVNAILMLLKIIKRHACNSAAGVCRGLRYRIQGCGTGSAQKLEKNWIRIPS